MVKLLTVKEASEYTGFSKDIIRKATNEGLIPESRTPGGHRRISKEDLEKFLQDRRGGA